MKNFNIWFFVFVFLATCLISVYMFFEHSKSKKADFSPSSTIEISKPKWRADAANGDLDAAYSLLVFGDVKEAEFEEKLFELANKNHLASTITLCTEYTGGSISGIKKNCALANKWCTKAKQIDPNVNFYVDIEKKCP
jgi:hypothetical protein